MVTIPTRQLAKMQKTLRSIADNSLTNGYLPEAATIMLRTARLNLQRGVDTYGKPFPLTQRGERPFRMGTLIRGLRTDVRPSNGQVILTNQTPYAIFQNNGTKGTKGRRSAGSSRRRRSAGSNRLNNRRSGNRRSRTSNRSSNQLSGGRGIPSRPFLPTSRGQTNYNQQLMPAFINYVNRQLGI